MFKSTVRGLLFWDKPSRGNQAQSCPAQGLAARRGPCPPTQAQTQNPGGAVSSLPGKLRDFLLFSQDQNRNFTREAWPSSHPLDVFPFRMSAVLTSQDAGQECVLTAEMPRRPSPAWAVASTRLPSLLSKRRPKAWSLRGQRMQNWQTFSSGRLGKIA